MSGDGNEAVRFHYCNHRGEVSERHAIPKAIKFGGTPYHPEPQWLLDAFDIDKGALRTFAMKDITDWYADEAP